MFFAQQSASELKELSKEAEIILTGKVTRQVSSWSEDKSRIYTQTTIEVEEYVKGSNNESSVVVKSLGGEVGDVGELYSHMPRFQDNEEVLLFLKKDLNDSNFKVLNGEEGKIAIVTDSKTGEKYTASNVKINSLKAEIKNYVAE
jgi:hypothetical protein